MPVSWPRDQVLGVCKQYAPLLPPIDGLDPARVLAALAMNESTVGLNCGPRYEPSWDTNGTYGKNPQQASNLAEYGSVLDEDGVWRKAAACSYGPWQVMFYNVPGYTPAELNSDLPLVSRASIGYLGRQIQRWKLTTLQEIGEMWNWGHPEEPFEVVPEEVQNYCKDLAGYYVVAADWLA